MAQIVVQDITAAGGIITYQNATEGGDSFSNAGTDPDGEVVLFVIGPQSGYTVTVKNYNLCDYGVHPNFLIVVPVGKIAAMSPRFNQYRFNKPDNDVLVDYSNPVGIQIAAVRINSVLKDT